ncbi:hypothetical protein PGT21_034277 [Puccinia graminis f. sp. tritici]|uniref:Uncharacterized protein n=1 Tax=Puccinia graminis f. sp. tritici TaxID=56615 RepID=A0A5B0MRD1_PUCGR|nr:hypothetical protein PGT21_034277 [Puccinia graminis f. sp. tritici]
MFRLISLKFSTLIFLSSNQFCIIATKAGVQGQLKFGTERVALNFHPRPSTKSHKNTTKSSGKHLIEHKFQLLRPITLLSWLTTLYSFCSEPGRRVLSRMFRSTSIAGLALIYACKAVDDYHWSQLDSPPTLDGILSPIKTSQAQNSHSDTPLSMRTNTFESISTQEPLLSFHNPNSPPSSVMDPHVHSHLDPVVPDDWNEFWTRDSQDLMRIFIIIFNNSCCSK